MNVSLDLSIQNLVCFDVCDFRFIALHKMRKIQELKSKFSQCPSSTNLIVNVATTTLSRKLEQCPILAKKDTFLEKNTTNFINPYSNPLLRVFHQNA